MRLIDADAIQYTDLNGDHPESKVRVYVTFKENIDRMPTVDAVPVVRCKDCKHHDGIRCFRWNSTIITGFDDFCSNSERKDGDHHEG